MQGDPSSRKASSEAKLSAKVGGWFSGALRFESPAVQIAFTCLFFVSVVGLMTLNLGLGGPTLEIGEVGLPAATDIKAQRDYTYEEVDARATEQKRDEAAAAVPSVYDYHIEYREQRVEQLRRSFADARRALSEAEDEWLNKGQETRPEAPPRSPSEREVLAFRVKAAEPLRAQFEHGLQEVLEDADFQAMAQEGFSPKVEEALVGLVDEGMSPRVVTSRRLLEAAGEQGILLRRLQGEEVTQTLKIVDFSQTFLDLGDIRRQLELEGPQALKGLGPPELRQAVVRSAVRLVQPNTVYNPAETERRRQEARGSQDELRVVLSFRRGQNIVDRGHIISARHVKIVQEMEAGTQDGRLVMAQVAVGTLFAVLAILGTVYVFSRKTIRKFNPRPRDMVLLGSAILLELALLQGTRLLLESLDHGWSVHPSMLWYGVPVALGAMLVRMVINSETALVYSAPLAVLAGLTMDQSVGFSLYVLVSSVIGARAVGHACQRMDLVKAGLMVGLVNVPVVGALALLSGQALSMGTVWAMVAGFAGGVLSGLLVNAILPVVEALFRYTTDIKLLELADLNHPALKELILKAPGSYHHSVLVGTLAKEACEAIRANPLLARVGAYYHDIGKGRNPQYFAENMRAGHNPHDKLKPHMSALIIKAHVKDGLELARQHGLPQEIQDFIAMHHGTTLISYFYHRAKSQEDPDIPEVEEEDYRYPGPKPQTRETAIVMLADGIEAATRAMPDPTPARIKGLVQTMINKLFADGQFDECDLTLKDLNAIAKAFIRVLTSMYHTRPQYPDQNKHLGAKAAPKKPEPVQTTDEHKRKAEEAEAEAAAPEDARKPEEARKPEDARKPARLDSEPGLRKRKTHATPSPSPATPHPHKGRKASEGPEDGAALTPPESMPAASISGEFLIKGPNMERELVGLLAASRYQPPAPRPSFERMTGPLPAVEGPCEGLPPSGSAWCEAFDLGPASLDEPPSGAPGAQTGEARAVGEEAASEAWSEGAPDAPTQGASGAGSAAQGASGALGAATADEEAGQGDGVGVDPERAFGGDGVGDEAEFGAPDQARRQPLRRLGLS